MSEYDTVSSSTTIDHLYVGEQPVQRTAAVTVADGQTCLRGSAMGKVLYGAVTPAADAGNTGDGTVTAAATVLGSVKPIVGAYVLTCTTAVTNGGVFKLVDPNGATVATGLTMTVGAGAATVFEVAGLTFTVTDGATDFVAGDFFTLTLAAGSGQVKKLDKTAVDGSAEIYGILLENVTTSGATQVSIVDLVGKFNSLVVGFVAGTTYADIEADARLKQIYFGTPE